jgi:hypothetical protein
MHRIGDKHGARFGHRPQPSGNIGSFESMYKGETPAARREASQTAEYGCAIVRPLLPISRMTTKRIVSEVLSRRDTGSVQLAAI